ncbi:MAG: hypothetical protein NWF10_03610 [Candidatus Bathyarchaeota archaeon]|nr:hypothetical protein [Candidatus Bathyarchaeota archaeon]
MLIHPDKEQKRGVIVPFTTLAAKRFTNFTKNMEMAAILYLVESERKKGENRVLKKMDEKLVFVAKACYPIWLVPFKGAILIFDGLGLASHTLSYDTIPDSAIFDKDLQKNQKTTESYTATLIRNKDYFKNFSSKKEIKIEALMTNSALMEDFKTYLNEMKKAKRYLTNKVVLDATIKNLELQDSINQLSNLGKRNAQDIKNLDNSMKLLKLITIRKIKKIRTEIRETQNKYRKQVERTKPKVKKKILRIQSKYNKKIARKSKKFKKNLQNLQESKVELQKTLRYLKVEAKRCETKIRSKRIHKKAQWKLKLKRIKKKLPTLNKKIEANSKRKLKIDNALKLEIAQQKAKCDEHIESIRKIFSRLQAARDAKIKTKKQEIVLLEDLTNKIISSIRNMIHKKRGFPKVFDTITITGKSRLRVLVYLPFYLARYEENDKKRYIVYPPTLIGDMGLLTKMKGALGASKLKALLQSRSKAIMKFLNQLVPLIERNPMLEKDITETGIQASILLKKRLRVGVKKGLIELEKQNWISKKELETFSKILYIYTTH